MPALSAAPTSRAQHLPGKKLTSPSLLAAVTCSLTVERIDNASLDLDRVPPPDSSDNRMLASRGPWRLTTRKLGRTERRLPIFGGRRGRTACGALVTVLFFMLTTSAIAWRAPTRSEQQAIMRVATQTPHAGGSKVKVSRIHVSTVGPWASATVAIYFGNSPDYATDILHEVHGRWLNVSDGTAGEWCVMPRQDQHNLGFPAGYPCTPPIQAIVFSPLSYGISCHITDDGTYSGSWVYCWIGGGASPTHHIKLNLNGKFSLTTTTPIPLGLGGRDTPYGSQVTAGRFRCQSLRSGMKCTVIATGRGFVFNIDGARAV